MKNSILTLFLAASMLFTASYCSAQAFNKESLDLNLGVGFGGYLSYASYGDFSSIPAIFISVDKGIADNVGPGNIGIGGFIGFKSSSYDYTYFTYNQTGKWTDIVVGARGTYHFILNNDKLDLYGGLHLGLILESYKYTNNDPFYAGVNYDTNTSNVYYSFLAGLKYLFTDAFGAFAEVGYDIAYLKLGVTLKL